MSSIDRANKDTVQSLISRARERQTSTEQELESFKWKFSKNPDDALAHADHVFDAVNRHRLYCDFLARFDEDSYIEDIYEYRDTALCNTIMEYVASPLRSSSASQNLYNEAYVRECALFLNFLNNFLDTACG